MTNYSADRSERARQLVAEGRIGGRREGSGRPRKPRPSEMAAEAAHRHWEAIEAALVAGIENGTGESRARAAERWLRLTVQDATVELRERAERRVEPDRYVAMSDDDVRAEFARALALAIRSGELDARTIMGELLPAADIVEAEAVGEAPAA